MKTVRENKQQKIKTLKEIESPIKYESSALKKNVRKIIRV